MTETIIRVLMLFFEYAIETIFGPFFALINAFINSLNLQVPITMFLNVMETYFDPFVVYFVNLIPPQALEIIKLELIVEVAFFGLSLSVHAILKTLRLIKKMPLA